MPSIILAPINITSVSGGTVNFGDLFCNSPVSTSKTATGAGGGNTGDFLTSNTFFSATVSIDPDGADSNNFNGA